MASALLVDYVLTVAVSMSSAASNIGSAIPFVDDHKVWFAVTAIMVLASLNLRGIRESGTAFAVPTYAFMIGMFAMLFWGFFQIHVLGEPLRSNPPISRCTPSTGDPRFRVGLSRRPRVLVRQCCADRCGSDQQRGARVP